MDYKFERHDPHYDRILFVMTLDKRKMKERILIGDEQSVRSRLAGNADADVFCDAVRPLGSLIVHFEHDEQGAWNQLAIKLLYDALHSNRWQQAELESTASTFLSGKFATNDPVRMYAAMQIWNEYLKTRLVRERNAASEIFLQKITALTQAFHTQSPLQFDEDSGKPKPYDLTSQFWKRIPTEHLRLDLWYPDNRLTTECAAIHNSFFPLLIYYMNRLTDWHLCFCRCKVCDKIFLAKSLRHALCSDKCRKAQSLQNKRDFDERARENSYDRLYKNECQSWRNKINRAKKNPDCTPEHIEQMQAAFADFKKEALQRKRLVKQRKTSPKDFSDWVYKQSGLITF